MHANIGDMITLKCLQGFRLFSTNILVTKTEQTILLHMRLKHEKRSRT
jgi:hypothetical protein